MASVSSISLSPSLAMLSIVILCFATADVAAAKKTQLHFYFQEINRGPNTTRVGVAQANTTASSPFFFGLVSVADNLLTEGPEVTSKLLGRVQGIYASSSSQEETALMMSINCVFTAGEYNGSVLSIVGRNPIAQPVRELSVVGGSGRFRLARGYALARTTLFDLQGPMGLITVEYNVTVIHPYNF